MEWTQQDYYRQKKRLGEKGIDVILVDTIANPIEGADTVLYNPYELKRYPAGTVFLFYCDTGKNTRERLREFQRRFPDQTCVSLRGGRSYWRKNYRPED